MRLSSYRLACLSPIKYSILQLHCNSNMWITIASTINTPKLTKIAIKQGSVFDSKPLNSSKVLPSTYY